MKITYLVFISAMLFSCSEVNDNDLKKNNLRGYVKSVALSYFTGVEKFGEL
jgi:hypothetical protein